MDVELHARMRALWASAYILLLSTLTTGHEVLQQHIP